MNKAKIIIQGHRGARGHYPENTITGFIEAVKMGVDAIEMDVVISKDGKVVVSHEPWMNSDFCLKPDGTGIEKDSEKEYNLYKMTYSEIAGFDCGSKGNPRFPEQKKIKEHKPLLSDVIEAVDEYTRKNNLPKILYNIEIKSEEDGDGVFNPDPETFVKLVYDEVRRHNILNRCILQSFDPRIVRELRKNDQEVTIALLVENDLGFEKNIERLGFLPDIYAPEFILIDEALLRKVHEQNMKLITWTVNEVDDMKKLAELGVDGIISDYPDRVVGLIKEYRSNESD